MPNDLTELEIELLKVLSKNHPDSGWASREMAAQVGLGYSRYATMQASKALQRLVKLGLAAHLDDKRPIVWVITDTGRSSIGAPTHG